MTHTDRSSLFARGRSLLLTLALLLAPLSLAAAPAQAAPSCSTSGTTVTCTFSYSGAPDSWTVPADVNVATFDLYGAQGGGNFAPGGKGAHVQAVLNVTPGETLAITVAGQGGRTAGGYGGGGNGGLGYGTNHAYGGGGGSRLTRAGAPLLVAGGGGGSTGGNSSSSRAGGDSGSAGANGGATAVYGFGGQAGSPAGTGAGGAGGNKAGFGCETSYDGMAGQAGQAGQGGNGANGLDIGDGGSIGGGGGGGGYGGGGGGGSGAYCATRGVAGLSGAGGGGSSYIDASATAGSTTDGVQSGHGLVTVTYTLTDSSAPSITPSVIGTLGDNEWYTSDVTVSWDVADAESAISATSGCDTQSITSDTAGATFTCEASSVGGTASESITIKRDATAPAVSVTGVTNGAGYPLGSVPAAGCSTSDALSGVATDATLSISGGNADGTGSFTATCAGATDKAGNTGSASATYSVAYRWNGFLQPVDNLPTLNRAKAGSAIPVKFSLGGNFGLSIFAAGYPKVQKVTCGSSTAADEVEQTVTAGASSLSYDATTGQYTYTWKTDKSWAGSCRLLTVRLADGTEHTALFQLK